MLQELVETTTVSRPALHAFLSARLDAALAGRESICVVTGEPGTGKTHLVQQFCTAVQASRDDLLFAYVACNAITGIADAYMPFREILQHLSGDFEEHGTDAANVSRLRSFMQTSARAIAENGPDLVDLFVPGGALIARLGGKVAQRWSWFDKLAGLVNVANPERVDPEIGQDNIFEQYTRVIEAMACEAPLVLVIDDLHWSDDASLSLLFQLARRLVNDKVMIIAASRPPDDLGDESKLGDLFSELRRYFGDVFLDLSARPENEFINEYLEATGVKLDRENLGRIVQQTGGNPLFVVELLRQLDSRGVASYPALSTDQGPLPARVTGIFQRRVRTLTTNDRQILETACIQGFEFWAEVIADVQDSSDLDILRRLGGSLQRDHHVVVDAGSLETPSGTVSCFQFRHDLLREYIYQSLTDNERRVLHKLVAERIEARVAGAEEDHALQLANQFELACVWDKALKYRLMAADMTARLCAPIEAAKHYFAAIENLSKITPTLEDTLLDVRLRLASQLTLAGEYEQAEAAARAAAESAQGKLQVSAAWLAIARILRAQRDIHGALDALARAEAALAAAPDSEQEWKRKIDILLERATACYFGRDVTMLADVNRSIADVIEIHGDSAQRVSYYGSLTRQALSDSRFSPDSDAVHYAKLALHNAPSTSFNTVFGLAFALLWQERFRDSIELFERAATEATYRGDSPVRLQSLVYLSFAYRRLRDRDAVARYISNVASVLEDVKTPEYPAVVAAQRGWLAFHDGDVERALKLARSASNSWWERKPVYPFCWIADWVIFALAPAESEEARVAASRMLRSEQAWQRNAVVTALNEFLDCGESSGPAHAAAVQAAKQASYL